MLSSVAVRQWLSPLVAVLFTCIALTGILMWLHVRVRGVQGVHEMSGLAFAVVGLVHLASNWRALVAYFRRTPAWIALTAGAVACAALLTVAGLGGSDGDHDDERGGHERIDRSAAPSTAREHPREARARDEREH